LFWFRWQVFL